MDGEAAKVIVDLCEEVNNVITEIKEEKLRNQKEEPTIYDTLNYEESPRDKEKDDEPDELTRFMRDFKNRRSGRKSQN